MRLTLREMQALRLAVRNARAADCITPEHGWDEQFAADLDRAVVKLEKEEATR